MTMQTIKLYKSTKPGKAVMAMKPDGSGELCYWPPHASNKPDYRNRYVVINCVRYKAQWIKLTCGVC